MSMKLFGHLTHGKELKVKSIGSLSPGGQLVTGLAIIACGILMIFIVCTSMLKELQTDYTISKGFHPIDAEISRESGCTTRKKFFTGCHVYIQHQGQVIEREFSFIDLGSEKSYSVVPIAADSDPSLVSIDLAVEKLTNRTMMFIGLFIAGLLLAYIGWRYTRSTPHVKKILAKINSPESRPWQLGLVAAEDETTDSYITDVDGQQQEVDFSFNEGAWMLADSQGRFYLVVLTDKEGKTAVPVDMKLKVLSGSGSEIRQLQEEITNRLTAELENNL